eukprot:CAMPEP_0172373002 /NCGR_PEP_ID=MMETSP1060-20121228/50097_1 /TAXON_ID=37318 /ORGANISM="Pseudo-nitzschia pungens, Strain cf. cingulata" /LENGTH=130 /DNA_ID=CAMNT_0013099195 /DNA_START=29 /DNA_END=418 /DNA_ORIENTATION=+
MASRVSICLQSRQGRKVITLSSTASTKELYETASEGFGVPVESLKGGFPPRPIPSNDSTPISDYVSNQERVQVEFSSSEKKISKDNNGDKKKICSGSESVTNDKKNTRSSSGNRRSKRAASKAATESMPA